MNDIALDFIKNLPVYQDSDHLKCLCELLSDPRHDVKDASYLFQHDRNDYYIIVKSKQVISIVKNNPYQGGVIWAQ